MVARYRCHMDLYRPVVEKVLFPGRDAVRWRGYGWAGYRVGMRALHYWCEPAPSAGWLARGKSALDHALKRDLHVDCVVRSEPALARAVEQVRGFAPEVIVAHADGA